MLEPDFIGRRQVSGRSSCRHAVGTRYRRSSSRLRCARVQFAQGGTSHVSRRAVEPGPEDESGRAARDLKPTSQPSHNLRRIGAMFAEQTASRVIRIGENRVQKVGTAGR